MRIGSVVGKLVLAVGVVVLGLGVVEVVYAKNNVPTQVMPADLLGNYEAKVKIDFHFLDGGDALKIPTQTIAVTISEDLGNPDDVVLRATSADGSEPYFEGEVPVAYNGMMTADTTVNNDLGTFDVVGVINVSGKPGKMKGSGTYMAIGSGIVTVVTGSLKAVK